MRHCAPAYPLREGADVAAVQQDVALVGVCVLFGCRWRVEGKCLVDVRLNTVRHQLLCHRLSRTVEAGEEPHQRALSRATPCSLFGV